MDARPMTAIVVAVVFTMVAARDGRPPQAGATAAQAAVLPEHHPPLEPAPGRLPEGHPPVAGSGEGCTGGGLQWDHGFEGSSVLAPEPEVIGT